MEKQEKQQGKDKKENWFKKFFKGLKDFIDAISTIG